MTKEPTLEVFADYNCPYCWLAEQDLVEFEKGDPDIRVVRRAFELRPEPAPTLDPKGEYLTTVWRDQVLPLAEQMGRKMFLPPVQPRTRVAHRAAKYAASRGKFDSYHELLYREFFERGTDIGQIAVLVELAAQVGLDGAELRQMLESNQFEQEVLADEELAAALGVQAVPAFLFARRNLITGIQSVEDLRELCGRKRPYE